MTAPIEVHNEIAISAPAELIWDVLSDVEQWPSWWAACRWVRIESRDSSAKPLVFRWKAHPVELRSSIVTSNRPQTFTITADGSGVHADRAFPLQAAADGFSTIVASDETQVGPLPWLGRLYLAPRLKRVNQAMFDDLARAVKRRSANGRTI